MFMNLLVDAYGKQEAIMNERVERALNELGEYYDAVGIITTVHDAETNTTARYYYSRGNAYALERVLEDTLEELKFGANDGEEETEENTC